MAYDPRGPPMPRTPFQRLAIAATAITYLLIAVGGLVRASGAGLGCPDWPRCFGSWIPPASAAALPPEFDPAQFNPTLMWTEYLNRLLGVTVGFAILAATISAWRHHRRQPRILWPVVAAVLLTGFQGWLGGRVVANDLAAWIVTVHMLVALVIVSLLLVAVLESMTPAPGTADQPPLSELRRSAVALAKAEALPYIGGGRVDRERRRLGWWACAAIALALVQVGVGTQVRGRVDAALDVVPRAEALATVGALDLTHRELAAVTGLAIIGLWVLVWTRHPDDAALGRAASLTLAFTAAQVVAGLVLTGAALPPAAQVLHLTLASLMLGALTATAFIAWRWTPAPPRSV
jgi:cytochrome c oxidase assembly protein subunit 15